MANFSSSLHDETTFYSSFIDDLLKAKREVIIESPYITYSRMKMLFPIFEMLIEKSVKLYVITRDPKEHDTALGNQSEYEIQRLEVLGIQVFLCEGNHHRKLAMIDREVIWEGSLNILSQTRSREFMRRVKSSDLASETFSFLEFEKLCL